jgi:SAM-dependent methyltransferase
LIIPEGVLMQQPSSSISVAACQSCGCDDLDSALFLGFMPPVNQMQKIGERPREQAAYPTELLYCPSCHLVQLGCIVDQRVLFPPEYPYTSGTTKLLHDNFQRLAEEVEEFIPPDGRRLIVDIGSNDGTLLSKFQTRGWRALGIEPTDVADLANARGIPTEKVFFGDAVARRLVSQEGPADVVAAANCFAHIPNIHQIIENILSILGEDGLFVSESHYLVSLIEGLQFDTIYHEHLRYYSLTSLSNLFASHGLEIIHASQIATHGGSIRVYAARRGRHPVRPSVGHILESERRRGPWRAQLAEFRRRTIEAKLRLHAILAQVNAADRRIAAVGAPSRGSTLINYVGLDDGVIDAVAEVDSSRKIGFYMPGTLIPVREEKAVFAERPAVALLLSWHIADELMPKLRAARFDGQFLIPLPVPRLV